MPQEIKDYLDNLPPSTINNSRKIIREDWEQASKMNSVSAAHFLNKKYGWGLDPDRTANDYGEKPDYQSEPDPIDISDEELAELL